MTIAEKILAAHAGRRTVAPGDFITAKVDFTFANEQGGEIAINELKKLGNPKVFDPAKVALIADHFVPCRDITSAEQVKHVREFAQEQGAHFFDASGYGIEHVVFPEEGLTLPGQVIVGGDSHTCTYGALGAFATGMGSTDVAVIFARGEIWMKVPHSLKFVYRGRLPKWVVGKDLILHTIGDIGVDGALYAAMELEGEVIDQLDMAGRFTMTNMAIEAGAKTAICAVDDKTRKYVESHAPGAKYEVYESDKNAEYAAVYEYDVSKMEPVVAFPSLPSNIRPVSQAGNLPIDQVAIGFCTNGRIEDLRLAAEVLKGRRVATGVRCLVFPGSQRVYLKAMQEGLLETFVAAGAAVSTPTCGPCLGGHMGVLASGERCVATTNRNFVGRMGHPKSEVYLVNPAVAAASAVAGRIASPEEVTT
jgi:3-isopropylmalate/(R)-2-methylmalate dehydratase large subunit